MRWRTRGRRRRQRVTLRRRFDRACDAFESEVGEVLARLRADYGDNRMNLTTPSTPSEQAMRAGMGAGL